MSHRELNKVLQECPESPLFARDDFETSEKSARNLVVKFVEQANFDGHDPHLEVNSSEEQSMAQSSAQGSVDHQNDQRNVNSLENDRAKLIMREDIDELNQIDQEVQDSKKIEQKKHGSPMP